MSDIDGTLIPYDYNAVPSKAVVDAISLAQKHLTVTLVTGRSYVFIKEIIKTLQLQTGYAVVNNGAQVFDISEDELIYEQPIEMEELKEVITILHHEGIPFYLKQDATDLDYYSKGPFKPGTPITKGSMLFTDQSHSEKRIDSLFDKLAHLPHLNKHKTKHAEPGKFGIDITHVKATKMHGIYVVSEKLGVKKEEIIGVGDSYNDFSLLMASGLKVAMGNAIPELKEIADHVVPSVEQDGIVELVNKFILTPTP